jgi:hypothetical protein
MSEQPLNQLEGEVTSAQEALLEVVQTDPEKWWDARELREQARNGTGGEVMMYALTDLVNKGELRLNSKLLVRAK